MRAIVLHEPKDLRVGERERTEPGPGQVLLGIERCAVAGVTSRPRAASAPAVGTTHYRVRVLALTLPRFSSITAAIAGVAQW